MEVVEMIYKDYLKSKAEVLSIYEKFVSYCKEYNKTIDTSLETLVEHIRNDEIKLVILGESNSGKSTFINAFLGKAVVPMHALQCTSAIIEIKRADKFQLKAYTATGKVTTILGENKIREYLENNAALNKDYRDIPIATINEYLIKNKGKKGEIDSFIDDLKKDNIHNLDLKKYNVLISQYITNNAPKWENIITDIKITYQLPEEMNNITIVDTPGVGANGGVSEKTEKYLSNADAIIFTKYLKGQALESTSFVNFLHSTCSNKQKDALFLVFTGKGDLNPTEFADLKNEALMMYKKDINDDRILFVDSRIQLELNNCLRLKTAERIDKYLTDLENEGKEYTPVIFAWERSHGDVDRFVQKMADKCDFNSVQNAVGRYATVAHYLRLKGFLNAIETEYKRYQASNKSDLEKAKKGIKNPQELEMAIKQEKKEIEETYNNINHDVNSIFKKYADPLENECVIKKEAKKMKEAYEKKLETYKSLSEGQISDVTFREIRKLTFDTIDESKKFRNSIATRIIQESNDKLKRVKADSKQISMETFIPNFNEEDFNEMEKSAEDEAYKKIEGFFCDDDKYTNKKEARLGHLIRLVLLRLDKKTVPSMINNACLYARKCRDLYKEKLTSYKTERENSLKKLLEIKDNNDDLLKEVRKYEASIAEIDLEFNRIIELREELKDYATRV